MRSALTDLVWVGPCGTDINISIDNIDKAEEVCAVTWSLNSKLMVSCQHTLWIWYYEKMQCVVDKVMCEDIERLTTTMLFLPAAAAADLWVELGRVCASAAAPDVLVLAFYFF